MRRKASLFNYLVGAGKQRVRGEPVSGEMERDAICRRRAFPLRAAGTRLSDRGVQKEARAPNRYLFAFSTVDQNQISGRSVTLDLGLQGASVLPTRKPLL